MKKKNDNSISNDESNDDFELRDNSPPRKVEKRKIESLEESRPSRNLRPRKKRRTNGVINYAESEEDEE